MFVAVNSNVLLKKPLYHRTSENKLILVINFTMQGSI